MRYILGLFFSFAISFAHAQSSLPAGTPCNSQSGFAKIVGQVLIGDTVVISGADCNGLTLVDGGTSPFASVAALFTFMASNNNLAPPLYIFNANTITTPTNPASPAYQFKFGPPLFQIITDSNRSAIVGQSVQNSAAFAVLPAVIGYGVLTSGGAGNQVQGVFARGECQAAGGCSATEMDAWNTSSADAPDNYPATDGFGTTSVWTFGTKIAPAGTKINWGGIHFVQEPTPPGNSQFRVGIYATPAVFQHYGIFLDGSPTQSPITSLLIKNTGLGSNVPVIFQTLGTYTKANPVLETLDLSGNVVTQFRQDGGIISTISPNAVSTDALSVSLTNTKGGAGGFTGFNATSDAGTLTLNAGSTAGASAAIIRWSGGGSIFIDALNATGNIHIRSGATPSDAIVISSGQVVSLPAVATGTPTASLCIDASNNIIKKTTAGSCI